MQGQASLAHAHTAAAATNIPALTILRTNGSRPNLWRLAGHVHFRIQHKKKKVLDVTTVTAGTTNIFHCGCILIEGTSHDRPSNHFNSEDQVRSFDDIGMVARCGIFTYRPPGDAQCDAALSAMGRRHAYSVQSNFDLCPLAATGY